jgi:hypothetical protein
MFNPRKHRFADSGGRGVVKISDCLVHGAVPSKYTKLVYFNYTPKLKKNQEEKIKIHGGREAARHSA